MPDNNYFDDDHDDAGGGMPEGSEPRGRDKDGEGDEKTALINSDICPDMKPGDVMELRVVAVHEGEYQVQYQPKEEGEHEEGEHDEEAMAGKEGAPMDSMMD